MGAWGYGWNDNDAVSDRILDICNGYRIDALVNGKKVIGAVTFDNIDRYREDFMIYMNVANSLGAVASFNSDDVEIFAKASATIQEFLDDFLEDGGEGRESSPWEDFAAYRSTVRGELECFNEWLKGGA